MAKKTKAELEKELEATKKQLEASLGLLKYVAYSWMAEHEDNTRFINKLSILRKEKVKAEEIAKKVQELGPADILDEIFSDHGVALPLDTELFNATSIALQLRTEEGHNGFMLHIIGDKKVAKELGVGPNENRSKH